MTTVAELAKCILDSLSEDHPALQDAQRLTELLDATVVAKSYHLTATEETIFLILKEAYNKPITADELTKLVRQAMQKDEFSKESVWVHIRRIRGKLGDDVIHTIRNVGYVFNPDDLPKEDSNDDAY